MKAKNSFMVGSFSQRFSVGSLMYCMEMTPTAFSTPAGFSTEPIDADTWFR